MADFIDYRFLGASNEAKSGDPVLLGCPYDGTASFRPGARFAPAAIRQASQGLETYSPDLDRDLEDIHFQDLGDLELPFADQPRVFELIRRHVSNILNQNGNPIILGGEHTISIPVVSEILSHHSSIKIIQLDAHLDLRDDYLGDKICHATVMRRIAELVGWENVLQVGIRSGTRDEWQLAKHHHAISNSVVLPAKRLSREDGTGIQTNSVESLSQWVDGNPVYLTVDLDIFDPGVMGGVGTPEPGGWFYRDFIKFIKQIQNIHLVGIDVVELSPLYDPSGASSILAAKVVRELILLL
jgi:agmatinase